MVMLGKGREDSWMSQFFYYPKSEKSIEGRTHMATRKCSEYDVDWMNQLDEPKYSKFESIM